MREKSIENQCLGRACRLSGDMVKQRYGTKSEKNMGHPHAGIDHSGMGRQKAEATNKIRRI